ncbi:MAG: hypothetical protein KGQ59_10760, partial [Bdellovibrionales bacterium]|nr:hypothetical protein [Bdellovibrionales bacterium]
QKFAEGRPAGTGALSEWEFPRMVLPTSGLDLKAIVDAFENHLVDQALARTGNNKNRASELLQMNRTTLVEKLRKRGMIKTVGSRNRMKGDEVADGQMNDAVLISTNANNTSNSSSVSGGAGINNNGLNNGRNSGTGIDL